ncbi:YpzG family protein [Ectobacillus panaciterrae]|uniref:YpzG family protein n=1 Tax=Ectobacillus panaciterrae TaxID=363872 RepID=UPI00040DBA06|nr:YpzG family protein [Ectobacillus panaciterrae]
MSYRENLDPHSKLFNPTWARPKHQNSQVNGQTQITQQTIILKSNAKAHKW